MVVEKHEGSTMNVDYVHIPKDESLVDISGEDDELVEKINNMINDFEDLDDVQHVFHNVDL